MFQGFADSFPSESIQAHASPGLAVSVLFPIKPGAQRLDVPVPQYKKVRPRNKADRARELASWLLEEKSNGLRIPGLMLADTWQSATEFGLRLLTELPNVEVRPHYESYRLYFDNLAVDFPHAVALQYYFFVMHFGCLRAATKLPPDRRQLQVLMDRFPHTETGGVVPGAEIPPTPGVELLGYMDRNSPTWRGLHEENAGMNTTARFGNLNWWRESEESDWQKGKTHPHFKLPDWLNQAIVADTHYDDYVASFDDPVRGKEIADALKELCQAFRAFDIWMMSPQTIERIHPNEVLWEVPDDAREFLMSRISRSS